MEFDDNVLGLRLCCNDTNEILIVYCVYLPPDSSRYGQYNETILNTLVMDIYKHSEANNILVCGDFNARTGNLPDTLEFDDISERIVIDETVNRQGKKLLDFVGDIRGCIVNGRVTSQLNGFTSVSHKGLAVVDYVITRQGDLKSIVEMAVVNCIDLVHRKGWMSQISDTCRIPDHNLMSVVLETSSIVREGLTSRNLGAKNSNKSSKVIRNPGLSYMKLLPMLLSEFEEAIGEDTSDAQAVVDSKYQDLISLIHKEAASSVTTRSTKRTRTVQKDYWTSELSAQWKLMHTADRRLQEVKRHNKPKSEYVKKLQQFKEARRKFDKLLKKTRKDYCKGLMLDIEVCNTKDPNRFWQFIKKLGPSKHREPIPWEVKTDQIQSTDKETVLRVWRDSFKNLYEMQDADFDFQFQTNKLKENNVLLSIVNEDLNYDITSEEVEKAVCGSKNRKAVGCDLVPNELLKDKSVISLVHGFLKVCYSRKLIPECWNLAIICPIPKEKEVLLDPMMYRGIALQCCMYKILSSILNTRLSNYLEDHQLLADEQNGFRQHRSCQHHIFSLINLIREG